MVPDKFQFIEISTQTLGHVWFMGDSASFTLTYADLCLLKTAIVVAYGY